MVLTSSRIIENCHHRLRLRGATPFNPLTQLSFVPVTGFRVFFGGTIVFHSSPFSPNLSTWSANEGIGGIGGAAWFDVDEVSNGDVGDANDDEDGGDADDDVVVVVVVVDADDAGDDDDDDADDDPEDDADDDVVVVVVDVDNAGDGDEDDADDDTEDDAKPNEDDPKDDADPNEDADDEVILAGKSID